MCGIVGYVGEQQARDVVIEGLRRLEYRGYDSAGVAVLDGGEIQVRREAGKIAELTRLLEEQPEYRGVLRDVAAPVRTLRPIVSSAAAIPRSSNHRPRCNKCEELGGYRFRDRRGENCRQQH